MYRNDATDVTRYKAMNAIENRREEMELGSAEHNWSVQKKAMRPIWLQVRETSFSVIATLLREIGKRAEARMIKSSVQGLGAGEEIAKGVIFPTAVSVMQKIPIVNTLMSIPSLLKSFGDSRDARRTEERYDDVRQKAEFVLPMWEAAAQKAVTVLSQAGISEMVKPTPAEIDAIKVKIIAVADSIGWGDVWGDRWTGADDRKRQTAYIQNYYDPKVFAKYAPGVNPAEYIRRLEDPTWEGLGSMSWIPGMTRMVYSPERQAKLVRDKGLDRYISDLDGSRAAAFIVGTAAMMDRLAVHLTKMLRNVAPIQAAPAQIVSDQVRSASPQEDMLTRNLERNVQRAEAIEEEAIEQMAPGLVRQVEEGKVPPGLRKKPGFLSWLLDRVSFQTAPGGE